MEKKIPMRTCLGCNEEKPKSDFIRIVRSKDGNLSLDLTGKAQGRGAYLCKSTECLTKAKKSRRIERTLGVTVPEEMWEQMAKQLEGQN